MKLFFAWIESNEVFSKYIHSREDLIVFKCTISHRETETAIARLLTNAENVPHVNEQKPRYAIISYFDGIDTHVLLRGRLVHIPRHSHDGLLEWEVNAEPLDAADQIKQMIEKLKSDPTFEAGFYDTVGISEVLENKTELLCWDRKTGRLSLSDVLSAPKKIDISADIFDDSLILKLGSTPLNVVHVNLETNWKQHHERVINIAPLIARKFSNGIINTLTVESLIKSWPREGDKIGPVKSRCNTGYTVVKSRLKRLPKGVNGLPMTTPPLYLSDNGTEPCLKTFHHAWFKAALWVNFEYKQPCREVIHLSVLNGSPVAGGRILNLGFKIMDGNQYIEKQSSPTLLRGDRGKRLLKYVERVAKAHLIGSSRQVEVEFCVPFSVLHDVDLDTMIQVTHERLPGGAVLGKVVSYQLRMMTDSWVVWVKIAARIGENKESKESPEGNVLHHEVQSISSFEENADVYVKDEYMNDKNDDDWPYIKISGEVPRDPSLFRLTDLVEHIDVKGDGKSQVEALSEAQHPACLNFKDVIRQESFGLSIQFMDLSPKPVFESRWKRSLPIVI